MLLFASGAYNTVDGLRSIQTDSVLEWSLLLLSGLTALACGFGCWTRQPWARIATVVGLTANIPFRLIDFWSQYASLGGVKHLVAVAANVVSIVYLLRPKAAAAFRRHAKRRRS